MACFPTGWAVTARVATACTCSCGVYGKSAESRTAVEACVRPSPSPANAILRLQQLEIERTFRTTVQEKSAYGLGMENGAPMMDRLRADRCLEVARELRAAAEEARRTLQASRELVLRSQDQTSAATPACRTEDAPGPSNKLVTSLIEAYEAAEDDPDTQTRLLLGHVIHHVGRRIASVLGPRAAGIAVH